MAQQEFSGTGIAEPTMRYYNPLTAMLEMARTPTKYFSAQITSAGSTIVWTPSSSSLRFRLMGYSLQLTGNATISVAGVNTLTFLDNVTSIGHAADLFIPALSVALLGGSPPLIYTFPGNGYLSSTLNNKLNVSLSAALLTGSIRINVVGTEEP